MKTFDHIASSKRAHDIKVYGIVTKDFDFSNRKIVLFEETSECFLASVVGK